MNNFIERDVTLSTCWRAIILQGKNTASYKFSLAKSLLNINNVDSCISRSDLAVPFALNIVAHLKNNPKQSVGAHEGKLITACKNFNDNKITEDELFAVAAKEGFRYVFDAFHNVGKGEVPFRFFDSHGETITLTDNFYQLLESSQIENIGYEVDARWRLWETAISHQINPNLLIVKYDANNDSLFIKGIESRRVNVTSSREALSGYQKGKCFYCNRDISIVQGLESSCDVDHFFPESLKLSNINGIWNLVLACKSCNRWDKSDKVPNINLVEKLHKRNNFYVSSHHPLRETIINQTGVSEMERKDFLQNYYNYAVDIKVNIYTPKIMEESLI